MFSSHLYDHKFDIDDIIRALSGDDHPGRWLLTTRTGQLIAEQPGAPTGHITQGDDANHWHVIQPLSVAILPTFLHHPAANRLEPGDFQSLKKITHESKALNSLFNVEYEDIPHAFLRERMKDIALEWLDERNLIPPSMRHVKDAAELFKSPTGKIQIETPEN